MLVELVLVADRTGKLSITEVCLIDLDDLDRKPEIVVTVRETTRTHDSSSSTPELVILPDLADFEIEIVFVVPLPINAELERPRAQKT
jgi:hypothetical protein